MAQNNVVYGNYIAAQGRYLSVTNLWLPLAADFDFKAHLTPPLDIYPDHSVSYTLNERNAWNCQVEMHNVTSRNATFSYYHAACSNSLVLGQDVGAHLRAFYAYTTDEMDDFVESPNICAITGPLPTYLQVYIEKARNQKARVEEAGKGARDLERASKDKEKSLPPLAGCLQRSTAAFSVTTRASQEIPHLFLCSMAEKIPIPLHCFTDKFLKKINGAPRAIDTKQVRSIRCEGEKVTVVDDKKLEEKEGGDASHERLSLYEWSQAMRNLVKALAFLCSPDSTSLPEQDSTTYATEMAKHLAFVENLQQFEAGYSTWYSQERELCLLLLSGAAFEQTQ
ncbi:unnamed protein product [Mycena citricolor]|uniref:Uncharacterized protein n=1 Tax=Mycena citricolor TaxID=2018698 RepID=A0AAD2JZF9_9AGAR|nr:unnamed protein product [Mycena citricolor]